MRILIIGAGVLGSNLAHSRKKGNDVIFIVLRFSSLDSIIPIIENNKSKNIVFVGNNISVEKYMNLKNKNVLFSFFHGC